MDGQFSNNTQKHRFEYKVDSALVFANYRNENGTLYIEYVEAPMELRGTGAAGRLMKHIMDDVRKDNLKVIPICGYAASWLRKHKEYDDLQG